MLYDALIAHTGESYSSSEYSILENKIYCRYLRYLPYGTEYRKE